MVLIDAVEMTRREPFKTDRPFYSSYIHPQPVTLRHVELMLVTY
jgi:hypothetical protein